MARMVILRPSHHGLGAPSVPRPCCSWRSGCYPVCSYGMVINAYGVLGFVRPLTVPGAIAYVAASLPFDVVHGVATAVFLLVLYRPWTLRIARVVRKFDVRCR